MSDDRTLEDTSGYPFDEEDNEDEDEFDCHLDQHGSCDLAGTEECEFECPYRDQRSDRDDDDDE